VTAPGSASAVVVHAHAKLTLTLRVLGTRPDGFHELEALTVSLAAPVDRLVVARRPEPGVAFALAGAPRDVPADGTNLVVRAVERRADAAGLRGGWAAELTKAIPAGGGLGGGSADAAAALRAVQRLVVGSGDRELPDALLAEVAAGLGSDVPFCLTGGAAWMRGRGERVDPVARPETWVVTASPPIAVSTPAVYRRWDELGGPTSTRVLPAPPAVAALLAGATAGPLEGLVNDLEPAAESVEPRLAAFRATLEEAVGAPALLAGSGASYAVVLADRDAAQAAAGRAATTGALVHVGGTAPAGWSVEP
jgi:4-diphosphocytidyl-2-C-methyl-D-erythritol kinase